MSIEIPLNDNIMALIIFFCGLLLICGTWLVTMLLKHLISSIARFEAYEAIVAYKCELRREQQEARERAEKAELDRLREECGDANIELDRLRRALNLTNKEDKQCS